MKNYVQIGSNVGNDYFSKLMLELKEKSNIYLFEPNYLLIEELTKNYQNLSKIHNVFILNKGIVVDKNIDKLYVYSDNHMGSKNPNYGLTSILHRKSYNHVLNTIPMDGITFKEFLEIYSIKEIELLMIDTEGYDYEILNSIDIDSMDIKEIVCEHWGHNNDDLESKNINTGDDFLKNIILPKFQEKYSYNTIHFDEIPNDVFKKKTI